MRDLLSALPARHRRSLVLGALVCSPTLALLGTVGVSSALADTPPWAPAGVNAGDQAWLDSLAPPVAQGADGAVVPLSPAQPVLPAGGDLQVLTITQGGPGTEAVDLPAEPAVGDTAAPARLTRSGIPVRVLQSYVAAERMITRSDPGCRLHWSIVAGIGRVESDHARFAGNTVTASGKVVPGVLGPRLDGSNPGWATIRDSDGGRYDGDRSFDRAVGPMQFLPGTWAAYGADGDGDGRADPQDVDDAALGTARYLCAGDTDLSRDGDRWRAVMRYNHSRSYAALVLSLADTYASGHVVAVPAPPAEAAPPPGESASPTRPPGATGPAPTLPGPSPRPRPTGSPVPTTPTTPPTTPSTGPSATPPGSPTATPTGTPTGTAPSDPGTPTDSPSTPASPTDPPPSDPPASDPPAPTDPAPSDPAPPPSDPGGTPPPDPVTPPADPAPAPEPPPPAPAPADVPSPTDGPAPA